MVQGTMQVEIEGVAKTVKAGEPFLIPAGKVHDAKEYRHRAGPGSRHLHRREGQAARHAGQVASPIH